MRSLLARLGFESGQHRCATPAQIKAQTDSNRLQMMSTGDKRPTRHCLVSSQRAASPSEHAAAILEVLQGPGGRTGTIPIDELKEIHREVCLERDFEVIGWMAVGRELRQLIGAAKSYDWIGGRRVRVYRIPPAECFAHLTQSRPQGLCA